MRTKKFKMKSVERRGEDLEIRLLEFAARVGKVVDALPTTRLARQITGQLKEHRHRRSESTKRQTAATSH